MRLDLTLRLLIEMGLESLIHFMKPRKLAPGVVIVTEGDPGADVFIVTKGDCRLLKGGLDVEEKKQDWKQKHKDKDGRTAAGGFVILPGGSRLSIDTGKAVSVVVAAADSSSSSGSSDSSNSSDSSSDNSKFVLQGDGGTYQWNKCKQRQVGHLSTKGMVGDIALLLGVPQPVYKLEL